MYAYPIQMKVDALRAIPEVYPGYQVKDILVEGNCVHCTIIPPYPLSWIALDPVTLRLDEQPILASIRA